jgi:hypothetical protein
MAPKKPGTFIIIWIMIALAGCAGTPGRGGDSQSPAAQSPIVPKAAPVITQSFASPQIAPGWTWKVYLKASDADGDMKDIAAVVHQPGIGDYPISFTRLGEKHRGEFSGYLFLVIPPYSSLDNVAMSVTVQIRDRAGNSSQPIKLPLFIGSLARLQPPPPGVFQENDLGPIMVNLRTVGDDDRPGHFDRFRR